MDCCAKIITFQGLNGKKIIKGERNVLSTSIIVSILARNVLKKWCMTYLLM